ncbi:hypothetical protein S7335_4149 [Synechococcus sp. PCC 7335]|uniref:acyloxyacyl hydrolase n=1 Tax=Synechococcus sp. (strain ATCC 29403 / PCC 7335) TaxID=91464 RepID=UPI00017EBBA9|nr:acyloxyacyl hydrolase [Synechococcus sp. PCC 7335]EDX86445.1 hypothetical protein S7335_4149 [Synechococcus sp. PCC 7335]
MFFDSIKCQRYTLSTILFVGIACLAGGGNAAADEPIVEADAQPIVPSDLALSDLAEETPTELSDFAIPEIEQAAEQQPISWQGVSQPSIDLLHPQQPILSQQISSQLTSEQQNWSREVYEVVELESESPEHYSPEHYPKHYESAALLTQENQLDEAPSKFVQAGKQRWYVQGGLGADFDDDLFGLVGAGVSHFFYNGHSINLELNGLAVDQQGNNAVGLNLALLLRSHWIRGDNWSIYIDGGAGLLTTNNDVPDAGSSFNFTPQIGGGATFAVNDTQRIMTGLRWYHISNASLFDSNPGLDALYGYVGYNFPF